MWKMVIINVLILVVEVAYFVQGYVNTDQSYNINNFKAKNKYNSNHLFDVDVSEDTFDIDSGQTQPYIIPQLSDEEIRKVNQFKKLLKFLSIDKIVSAAASDNIPKNEANEVEYILQNVSKVMTRYGSELNEPINFLVHVMDNPQQMKKFDDVFKRATFSNKNSYFQNDYVPIEEYLSVVHENLNQSKNHRQFDDYSDEDFDFGDPAKIVSNVNQEQQLINKLEELDEHIPLAYIVYGASVDLPEKFRDNLLKALDFSRQQLHKINLSLVEVDFCTFILTHSKLMKKIIRALALYEEYNIVNFTVDEFFKIMRQHIIGSPTQKSAHDTTQNTAQKKIQNRAKITNPFQHVPPLIGIMHAMPNAPASTNVNVNALNNKSTKTKEMADLQNSFLLLDDAANVNAALEKGSLKTNVMRMSEKQKNESENQTAILQNGLDVGKLENGPRVKPSVEGVKSTLVQQNKKRKFASLSGPTTSIPSKRQTMKSEINALGSLPANIGTAEANLKSNGDNTKTPTGAPQIQIIGKSSGPI